MKQSKEALEDIYTKITLKVPSYYYGQEELCKDKVQDFLRNRNVDELVINRVNEDFCIGFSLAKKFILDMIEEENEKYLNNSETEELDSLMLNQPMTR